eukprot:CAMPEP_0113915714 /NCGR_PEP_ID=MMETSP0780_2-20120614/31462_1 /TAXON_ID=652834 /ORGANISM="Palpitomonas bilix" /LENGTH=324 /DNA_ID=CAMNT_0000914467 /DNA_START=476 /DNA_END=1450 /DNA_ORIENTATION=+ /assembly_acc=CAM_ASM_000599
MSVADEGGFEPSRQQLSATRDDHSVYEQEETGEPTLRRKQEGLLRGKLDMDRPRTATTPIDDASVERFFTSYVDSPKGVVQDSRIELNGFSKMLNDIDIQLESRSAWIVLYLFNAVSVGVITRGEFVSCAKKRRIADVDSLKDVVDAMLEEVKVNPASAKSFFDFCFGIVRESNYDRTVAFEEAIPVLATLMEDYELGSSFLRFLRVFELEAGKSKSYITQDQWSMLAPFMLKYKMSNLDEYSSDDAWPTLFDDFVDWTRSPGVYDEAEEGSECEEVEVSAVPTATKGFASILESDSVLERDEDEEDEEEGDGQDATKVESKGA